MCKLKPKFKIQILTLACWMKPALSSAGPVLQFLPPGKQLPPAPQKTPNKGRPPPAHGVRPVQQPASPAPSSAAEAAAAAAAAEAGCEEGGEVDDVPEG